MSRRSSLARLVVLVVLAVLPPTAARAQEAAVSAGLNVRFVSGTFGSNQTAHLLYAPAFLRVDVERFEFSGYFPYLMIDSGTVTLSQGGFVPMQGSLSNAPNVGMPMGGSMGGMMGGGNGGSGLSQPGVPSLGTTSVMTNQSGFGDLVAGAGYRVVDNALSGLRVVLSARVKLPTAAAARGLGTGQTDVAGVATVRKRFTDGWIYGEGGYLAVGKPPGVDLNNAVLWGMGGGRRLTNRLYLLASAYGNSALLPQFGAPAEAGAGLGLRLGERANLTVLPTVGFSDASPTYALSVGISTDMVRR